MNFQAGITKLTESLFEVDAVVQQLLAAVVPLVLAMVPLLPQLLYTDILLVLVGSLHQTLDDLLALILTCMTLASA